MKILGKHSYHLIKSMRAEFKIYIIPFSSWYYTISFGWNKKNIYVYVKKEQNSGPRFLIWTVADIGCYPTILRSKLY